MNALRLFVSDFVFLAKGTLAAVFEASRQLLRDCLPAQGVNLFSKCYHLVRSRQLRDIQLRNFALELEILRLELSNVLHEYRWRRFQRKLKRIEAVVAFRRHGASAPSGGDDSSETPNVEAPKVASTEGLGTGEAPAAEM